MLIGSVPPAPPSSVPFLSQGSPVPTDLLEICSLWRCWMLCGSLWDLPTHLPISAPLAWPSPLSPQGLALPRPATLLLPPFSFSTKQPEVFHALAYSS